MTTKTAFSEAEWKLVTEAPTSAGLIVITASKGGTFRETFAMSKTYAEARSQHGQSELLDEIVGSKPKVDRGHSHSPDELKANGLQHVRDAMTLLASKATEQEVEDYRKFVLAVANRVAAAHDEHGQAVSSEETAAIRDIESALQPAQER